MADSLEKLFEDFWAWRLQRTPELASLAGCKTYNDQLETFTKARFEEDFETCKKFLEQSRAFEARELSGDDKLNLELFQSELKTFVDGFPSAGFYFPVNNIEGVQVDFSRLADWMGLKTTADHEHLLKRYQKFPALVDQICDMLRLAVKEGKTNHQCSMHAVLDQFALHQKDFRETQFWEPFKDLDTSDADRLRLEAEDLIKNSVQPAMAKLEQCLRDEYLPNTRPGIGISSVPNGAEFYEQCLKFHTSSEKYTAAKIHEIGLAEVKRIEADMKKVFDEIGFSGTLKEFVASLRTNPKFTFTTTDEMFAHFCDILFKVIQPKLKDFFHSEPASELVVVQTPAAQSKAPAAYYIAGTSDGSRPGKIFVNCSSPDTRLKCSLISLALHEGNPGHHLHASFLLAQKGLPEFRKVLEDRNYFQVPSRFPINTAFCEGWALYCEKLGFDMGLYDDPYDRFGHYSEEMFRACRLVVDTGIHAFGWSKDRAVQFMLDHTATPEAEIEIEINRYIGWPGQAVGYKIGEIFLTELRRKSEKALGEKFDIRRFHNVLLRTSGPLDLVEKEVDSFIEASK